MEPENINVEVAGQAATIISIADRILNVRVSPTANPSDGLYLGGSGMYYKRYDLTNTPINSYDCTLFKTTLDTTTELDEKLVEEKIFAEPKTENVYGSSYG